VQTATPTPLPPLDLPNGRAFDVALLDISDGQKAVALIEGKGIFQTENGGYRWEPLWEPTDNLLVNPEKLFDLAVAPTDARSIYVAGVGLVMFSHDGGINWEVSSGRRTTFEYLPAEEQVYSLAVGYQDPMLVYAATQKGVFRSRNGGQTWQALDRFGNNQFRDLPIYTIAIDPTSSDKVIYAAGDSNQILYTTEADKDSFNWGVDVCNVCGPKTYVLAFGRDGTVFAGGAKEGGMLVKKEIDDQNWEPSQEGIRKSQAPDLVISNLVVAPGDPSTIYAGTGWRENVKALGIYHSLDEGLTWQTINDGLLAHENPAPYVQGIAAAGDGTLFIATHDGVYQLNDESKWEKE
jgi:photosystem II stability/assembly factor-like uncharacterized protein